MRSTNQRFQLPLVAYLCTLIFVFTAVDARAAGDLNCDDSTDVFDVQLLIMKALGLPFVVDIDSNQDGIHDACPSSLDTPGIISVGGEGDITCADIIDPFPLQNCDLPLSDFGASAPENALYDDTATYAELCPESLSECFSDVDPASYCGTENMAWDSALNQCIVEPVFTAAKDQCNTDLSNANTAKATAESDLATCQFDLAASLATPATGNTVVDPKTHWLSNSSSFELLKAGHDCTSSDSKIGVVNTVAECAALCEETSGCEVFIFEHTSGTPAKCWAESATKTNCTWKSGAWDAYGLVPATTYTSTLLSECSSEEFESKASTLTSDRECSNITQCTSNQYELTAPTATSDRVCQDQPTCASGQIVAVPGTSTSPQVCENPCPAGQYKDVAADACVAVTACTAEEVETKAPTAMSDRECGPKPNIVTYTFSYTGKDTGDGVEVKFTNEDGHSFYCSEKWDGSISVCHGEIKGKQIALKGLPANMSNLFLTTISWSKPLKSDIHQIVEISGPTPSLYAPNKYNFGVYLSHSVHNPGGNGNYVHSCPLGTSSISLSDIPQNQTGWGFHHNGSQSDWCTLPGQN